MQPTYERTIGPILADPNIDAVIALFVPPVVEDPQAVEEVLARYAKESDKPLLSVVMSADGSGRTAASSTPSRRHTPSASPRSARSGCGGPPARRPRSTSIWPARARDHRRRRRRLARRRRLPTGCSRRTGSRSSASAAPRRPTRRRRSQRSSGCPPSSRQLRPVRTRRNPVASLSTCEPPTRFASAAARDRRTGDRPAVPHRGRGAARGDRAGPGLRAARRLRPGRCARRADRISQLRSCAADRRRCLRAARHRQGREARRRLARSPGSRSGRRSRTSCTGSRDSPSTCRR